jgi:hypothetical protein
MSFRTQGRVVVEPPSVTDSLRECTMMSPQAWQAAVDADIVDDIKDEIVKLFSSDCPRSFGNSPAQTAWVIFTVRTYKAGTLMDFFSSFGHCVVTLYRTRLTLLNLAADLIFFLIELDPIGYRLKFAQIFSPSDVIHRVPRTLCLAYLSIYLSTPIKRESVVRSYVASPSLYLQPRQKHKGPAQSGPAQAATQAAQAKRAATQANGDRYSEIDHKATRRIDRKTTRRWIQTLNTIELNWTQSNWTELINNYDSLDRNTRSSTFNLCYILLYIINPPSCLIDPPTDFAGTTSAQSPSKVLCDGLFALDCTKSITIKNF